MADETTNIDAAQSEASQFTDLLAMPWFILGQPWAHSDYAGTRILAGSPDPHVGAAVLDAYDVVGGYSDVDTARALAEHIVLLHNASLIAG